MGCFQIIPSSFLSTESSLVMEQCLTDVVLFHPYMRPNSLLSAKILPYTANTILNFEHDEP